MLEKNNTWKVMELFFKYPTATFNIREIGRRAGISTPTASYMVDRLARRGFIHVEERHKMKFVKANNQFAQFIKSKKIYNLESIYGSGLIEAILERALPSCIVLFGSYSRGEDVESSDIDIAIFYWRLKRGTNEFKKFPRIADAEKKLARAIHLQLFRDPAISKSKKNKDLINNIANGIVLYGYLRLV